MTKTGKSLWDERFAGPEYAYGTRPNRWLEEHSHRLRPASRILSLGEGEGRNAVWLAERGHQVVAVDGSEVGLEKARALSQSRAVEITTTCAALGDYAPALSAYDAVILIYLHLTPRLRATVHAQAAAALVPGGLLLLEAFSPRQLEFASGGPKDGDLLYAPETLRSDFKGLVWETLLQVEIDLSEGPLHSGRASVVRGLARRPG